MTEDHTYFVGRAEKHRRLAVEAGTIEAKALHLRLADEYAAKAARLSGHCETIVEGAALQPDETDAGNIDQTRTAGSDSIRDHGPRWHWGRVDEASDESFPASDPPSIP